MTFIDADSLPEEDLRLVGAMSDDYEGALGDAVDLSMDIKLELVQGARPGLIAYIRHLRTAAIQAVVSLKDINPSDEMRIAEIQRDILEYSRAVAFAQQSIAGYIDHQGKEIDGEGEESDTIVISGAD